MTQMALDIGLAPVSTLGNFVPVGNEAALEHLKLWAGNALRSPVPTFLWGVSGSGKSHLLRAVREALRERGSRVGWLDASILHPTEFDEHWDAVLLDDCQLYTAEQQGAAFNWFVNAQNPAHGSARWVLAAGDRPPADLQLREDLRTRLGWGHVFQLHALGEAERRSVLRRAADARGVFLSDEVMDFMLNRFSRDLSSLMMLLDQLDAYALRTQRAITIPLIKSMLENE
ncbi:DnaA regulatory inactivator Hda [Hydrogenophaga sp. PAMC20947]|uniref:DnaA regulatory inactivator Hda n=1 Tax=Hydrogenophaga sp. PAMC20947 TaxID=2565558 RepID=UPI00109DFBB2|nr:DnaA regulatory inactivator Hda [Hydrogenophaga sp. PAMC20947]QCB48523.1 DnaA regulatory inactivator Hda [Hydrogenophaga sp. PAMC20947]